MAEKRQDNKSIFQAENVIVHKTVAQGGDVPSMGHVHEERDVPIASLVKAIGFLIVGIVLVTIACWGLFEFFSAQAERADPQLSPLAERRTPPGPKLQSNPAREMAAFRRHEDSALAATGTANDGTRRVSVDEAMTMIAERGLPQFTAAGTDSTGAGAATGATNATRGTSSGGATGTTTGGATGGGATSTTGGGSTPRAGGR